MTHALSRIGKQDIPISELRKLVRYDRETGKLHWLSRPVASELAPDAASKLKTWNTRYAGTEAFATKHSAGYFEGCVLGVRFLAHRVAFALAQGRWPVGEIDHIDHDKQNNRLANLRETSHQENALNTSLRSDNSTGCVGVYQSRGQWEARIKCNGKGRFLGYFPTFELARDARLQAQSELGFHENHGCAV
jgi:hypothetical protein